MPRSIVLRLIDIRDAISGIGGVVAGATFDDYANTWGKQRAVERGLESSPGQVGIFLTT
jgi:hypothetical protein